MPKRKNVESGYECNCERLCGGINRPVTAADWKKHRPFRIGRVVDALKGVIGKAFRHGDENEGSSSRRGRHKRCRTSGSREQDTGGNNPQVSSSGSNADPRALDKDANEIEEIPSGRSSEDDFELQPPPEPIRSSSPRSSRGSRAAEEEGDDEVEVQRQPDPEENPEYGRYEETGAPTKATLNHLKRAQQYVRYVKKATLKKCGMDKDSIARMRNPPRDVPDLAQDPTLRLALRQFIANGHSEKAYEANRRACMEEHPERTLPSLKSIKRTVEELTGINPIVTDMCPNSCIAYTGPFAKKTKCPLCAEHVSRYIIDKGKNIPRRTFDTYPFGPQAQALMRTRDNAERMHHRHKVTEELKAKLGAGAKWDVAEDVYFSKDVMDAVDARLINSDHMVLMFSVDGAQLYESKASDCWLYIWVLFDLSPKLRYKKCYVLPGAIIPGPNKPKDLDSFLLPGLMHISALQKEGLKIWDAAENQMYVSHPIVIFASADNVAMSYINGLVGHSGAQGCCLWCPMRSRHKHGTGYYYPAMLKPYHAGRGSDHNDYSARTPFYDANTTAQRYKQNLDLGLGSTSQRQYDQRRLATGIGKPSIFSGFPLPVGIPQMFPGDVMHHLALNIPDLMIALFRGTFRCLDTDDVANWPWAVFYSPDGDELWQAHGSRVAQMSRYIPSSFGKSPRNIAAKINSGYKAWEHMYHFYMVLPGLLWPIMDEEFFGHYCKLVAGARFSLMLETPVDMRPLAHKLLVEFTEDFERLYYARCLDRLIGISVT